MTNNPKTELTPQQIDLLLQIITRQNFSGDEVEIVVQLKQTLISMLREKQNQKTSV